MLYPLLNIIFALLFAPLLFGLINRVKAFFAGRKGQPILQLYYDLYKLVHRGSVYSTTTSFVFWFGPLVSLSCMLIVLLIMPFGSCKSFVSFPLDIIFFIYLFGVVRFFTVLSALDTGSSFEGMGASREMQFAVFAEPTLFLGFIVLVLETSQTSLCGIYLNLSWQSGPILLLVWFAFFMVFLAENSRIPVDDPNTHLELTMIHEVMVLDHSGVDFAVISYAMSLKFWILGSLIVGMLMPFVEGFLVRQVFFIVGMFFVALVVGFIESSIARLKLIRVPYFLVIALCLVSIAIVLKMR